MKKRLIPIIAVSLFLASCSAAYKTGQTPDDIYYSSNSTVQNAVAKENAVVEDESYGDDAYLRMKVRNHGKWNTIDDKDYWYGGYNSSIGYYNGYSAFSPYNYGYGYGYNSFALSNPYSIGYGIGLGYSSWNYNPYYNPWGYNSWGYYPGGYYNPVVIVGGKYPLSANSSRPSLSGYGNKNYYRGSNSSRPQYSRQYQSIFESNGNSRSRSSSNSTYEAPSRTFNSGSGSSSGSSGSSSGGGSSRSSGGGSSSRGGRGG